MSADLQALHAFVAALSERPDTHDVLTVATRESDHRDVSLVLGDLRGALDEVERLRKIESAAEHVLSVLESDVLSALVEGRTIDALSALDRAVRP